MVNLEFKFKIFIICILVIKCIKSQCTTQDAENIIYIHNYIRNNAGITFGPKPLKPIPQLKWSNQIAQKLQTFVNSCQYNTVPDADFSEYGYASFRISGSFDPIRTFNKTYYHDAPLYDWNTKSCVENSCCYTYPVLVWASTTEVGCAKMSCGSVTWLLCGYNPMGGFVGINPYPSIFDSPYHPITSPTNKPILSSGLLSIGLSLNLLNGDIDWRNINGVVTQIKDQGDCGSCWAFSGAASLESNYIINNTNAAGLDLSEQYFVDCTYNDRDGCTGGNSADMFEKFKSSGVIMENADPYQGVYTGQCPQINSPTIKWTGYKVIQPNKQAFINELKYGPIVVSLYADSGFMNYKNGIYYCKKNSEPNHAVAIVGYNELNDYFIIKNSWSTSWGQSGFGYLAALTSNCNLYQYPAYRPVFTG